MEVHNYLYVTVRLFCYDIFADLANQHADFIDREALCKVPRPRVISIPSHPSQAYMPPCTILHRCNDETGCCKSQALKCVPKQYEIVTLYFIVSRYLLNTFPFFFFFSNFKRNHFVHFRSAHIVVRVSLKKNTFTITQNVIALIKLYHLNQYSNQNVNVLVSLKLAIVKTTNVYVIVQKKKVTNARVKKRASNIFP